jgi:hypothetical protein
MKQLLLLILLLSTDLVYAQTNAKSILAVRTEKPPTIDGFLEAEIWSGVSSAKGWTQTAPRNGELERAHQKSEVQFIYDDKSLYINALFHDSKPDSISREFSLRDEWNKNCDWFGLWITPYNGAQNEFMFAVTAAGVQLDSRSNNGKTDMGWDAVWLSAVNIHEEGWSAELEIPFAALRIPNTEIQEWGLNINRTIKRTGENYIWSPIDVSKSNWAAQAGILKGIKNINTPIRLSLTPYLSSYLDSYESQKNTNINGGLDLKYGINESFTLDMTLVPDFGQTVFDNEVLNVSPFEIRLDENRNFFTEGTELFNKGDLFYSRRIGYHPTLSPETKTHEVVVKSPTNIQLLNASKISGRTAKGTGIAIFNAITQNTYATIKDTVTDIQRKELIEPISNYNVIVIDQVINDNSYITFTNTNVSRKGKARNSNVEKLQTQIATKNNRFRFYGDLSYSHTQETDINTNGFASNIKLEKSNGKFRFNVRQKTISENYNINDLGYLQVNNTQQQRADLTYHIFQPIGKLRKADFRFSLINQMIYKPNKLNQRSLEFDLDFYATNFFSSGLSLNHTLGNSYDYYEARTNDLNHVFVYGPTVKMFWWNSLDDRKKFSGDLGFGYESNPEFAGESIHIRWAPQYRVNDHLFMSYVISHKTEKNNVGRAFDANQNNLTDESGSLLFSERNRKTITNVYRVSYVLNSKLSFNLKLRHYWSTLKHKAFFELKDGALIESDFSINDANEKPIYNVNYNTWNLDLNCHWRFAPGSELNFQWKNSVSNLISDASLNSRENLNRLFEESQGNNLSLRWVYYLDYHHLKK